MPSERSEKEITCSCMAQMQPHDPMPGICPVKRATTEWKDRRGWTTDQSGRRHSTHPRTVP